jgi:hypothetical protein
MAYDEGRDANVRLGPKLHVQQSHSCKQNASRLSNAHTNVASTAPTSITMAPSRALFRLAFATRTRPSPFLLSASAPKTQLSRTPPTLQRGRIHQSSSSFASARSYSQEASAAPEPPDYLNDAELHIFNKVKGELDPVKLEVCKLLLQQKRRRAPLQDQHKHANNTKHAEKPHCIPQPQPQYYTALTRRPPTGPRHKRRLRLHVRH